MTPADPAAARDNRVGLPPGWRAPPPGKVTLLCPTCKRRRTVDREDHDPPKAAFVVLDCDRHDHSGDKGEDIEYRDCNGRTLKVEDYDWT